MTASCLLSSLLTFLTPPAAFLLSANDFASYLTMKLNHYKRTQNIPTTTDPPTSIHAHTSALPLWLSCFHLNIISSCPLKKMILAIYPLFPVSLIFSSLLITPISIINMLLLFLPTLKNFIFLLPNKPC